MTRIHIDSRFIISVPLIYILIVFIVKIIADKKRSNIHKILSQIDSSIKQYSADALATALPSIVKSELTVQWVIKEGIMLGNQSVINKEFLHFCIKKFNKSQWFISLISFLVGVDWEGQRSSAYRILLHALSLQNSVFTSLQLFQIVYIMNQNSDVEMSQIISREISRYRSSLHFFAKMHQKFWVSALQDDEKEFKSSLRNIFTAKIKQKHLIHSLLRMYEFSPSVQLHASLYYSDISQNYIKSGKHYQKAVLMQTNREEYISTEIFNQFSSLLPKSARYHLLKKEKNSDGISFLSVRTSHNTALRCQPEVTIKDDFFESLCQSYSIPDNTAKQEILPFASKTTLVYKIAFFILMLVYIAFAILAQIKFYEFNKEIKVFKSRLELISNTIQFRWHLTASSLDIRLLVNIINETYQPFTNNSIDFYFFVVDHLSELTDYLVKYESQINQLHVLNDNLFSNEFGELHNYCKYFITTRDISNLMKTVSDNTLDKLVNPLESLSETLYTNFTQLEKQRELKVKKVFIRSFIGLIAAIIIVYIFSIVFFILITDSIENFLFLILKTVQTVVISEIQQKFINLFNYDHPRKLKRNVPQFKIRGLFIFSMVMMALSLILTPLYNLVLLFMSQPSGFKPLPVFMNITSEVETIYYTLSHNEFGIGSKSANCMHTFGEIKLDGFIQPSKVVKHNLGVSFVNVTFIIFAIFFVLFLVELRSSLLMYKFVQVVLKFIPQDAADSSPVLAPLWRGQSLKKSDVIHFKQMILTDNEIENSGFFCLLFFNKDGEVIRTIGDVVGILHCQPKTLWQLVTYIKENSSEPHSLIDEFFNNSCLKSKKKKSALNSCSNQIFSISSNSSMCNLPSYSVQGELETVSISLEPFHEIALTFSDDGKVLTIKDDGHHFLRNQQLRSIMNARVPSIQQKNSNDDQNPSNLSQQQNPFLGFQMPQNSQTQKIIYNNCFIVISEVNLSNLKFNENEFCEDFSVFSNSPIVKEPFIKNDIFLSHDSSPPDLVDISFEDEILNNSEFPNSNINENNLFIDFKTVMRYDSYYIMICDNSYAPLILNISKKLNAKTVIHENGQICVFQRSKLLMRPQIFGQGFEEAKTMMLLAENADLIVSKNFWILTSNPPIEFDNFSFGVDIKIQIHRFVRNVTSEFYS